MTTAPLPIATETRLRKAALDDGFDVEPPRDGHWLAFTSPQAPLRLWLGALGDTLYLAALSQPSVAHALAAHGTPFTSPLPPDAVAARGVTTLPALHGLLRASHIRPWADCATDAERLDVFNGLLLAAHLDAAFDQHLITLADDGTVLPHASLPPPARCASSASTPRSASAPSPTPTAPGSRTTAPASPPAPDPRSPMTTPPDRRYPEGMKRTVPGYTRITCDPEILDGRPCVRGMRLSVQRVLEILAQYPDWDRIADDYPDLEREDIPEVLRFAAEMMDARSLGP